MVFDTLISLIMILVHIRGVFRRGLKARFLVLQVRNIYLYRLYKISKDIYKKLKIMASVLWILLMSQIFLITYKSYDM